MSVASRRCCKMGPYTGCHEFELLGGWIGEKLVDWRGLYLDESQRETHCERQLVETFRRQNAESYHHC